MKAGSRKLAKSMPQHTPSPWRIDGCQTGGTKNALVYMIVGGKDCEHPTIFVESICRTEAEREQLRENAELIVKAVNAYLK